MSNYSHKKYDLISGDQDVRLFVLIRSEHIEGHGVSPCTVQVFSKAVHLEERVTSLLFSRLMKSLFG